MKRLFPLLCLLGALLASGGLSHALTIPASEDTFVYLNKISSESNNATLLPVDSNRKALIYFNLDEIPKNAVVRWAKLRLFLPAVTVKGSGLNVYRVTSQWDEAVASSQPSIETTPVGTIGPEKLGTRRFVTLDVTSIVQSWISLKSINEGFAVGPVLSPDPKAITVVNVISKDAVSGLPAELDIDFKPDYVGDLASSPIAFDQLSAPLKTFLTPNFTTQPSLSSQGILSGAAQGIGTLSYQWLKDGVPIAGGTSSQLKLTTVPNGTYALKVSNGLNAIVSGTLVSDFNKLDKKYFNLSFTVQPVLSPDGVLKADLTGIGPLSYQWLRNGVPVSGGTSSAVSLTQLSSGTYSLRASNGVVTTMSESVVFDPMITPNGHVTVPILGTSVSFSKYETTLGQWKAFVRETGWKNSDKWLKQTFGQTDLHPVVNISAQDAVEYCQWLSAKTGRTFRLPTSSEWLVAAGGSLYPWGDNWPPNQSDGNYNSFTETGLSAFFEGKGPGVDGYPFTAPVGSFRSNQFALFDLGGNVGEFTLDPTTMEPMYLQGASYGPQTQSDVETKNLGRIPFQGFHDSYEGFRVVVENGGALEGNYKDINPTSLTTILFPNDNIMSRSALLQTIEFWVKRAAYTASYQNSDAGAGTDRYSGGQEHRGLSVSSDGRVSIIRAPSPWPGQFTAIDTIPKDGKWHHVAFTGDQSGSWYVYADGIQVLSGSGSTSVWTAASPTQIFSSMGCQIDEVRWSDITRYKANFTPQRRFTSDSNTLMLLHFDEGSGTVGNDSGINKQKGIIPSNWKWVTQ